MWTQLGVALFNRRGGPATITTSTGEIGFGPGSHRIRDLWTRAETGTRGEITVEVPSHGVTFLRISPGT